MTYGVASLLKSLRGPAASLFCLTAFGVQKAFAEPEHLQVQPGLPGDVHAVSPEIADAAHAGAEAHGSGGLPQFDPSSFASQVFWLAIAFAVLYVVFSRKTLPSISSVIENRREQVQSDRDMAERLKNEAEAVLNAYEKGLETARSESSRLMAETEADMKAVTEKALQVFQSRAEDQMTALEGRLNDGKQQAMDEMNTIAAEIAAAAAEKIVGISTDLSQAKTVVQSLNKLSKAA